MAPVSKKTNIPRILLVLFLLVFILQMLALLFLLLTPLASQAKNPALDPGCWRQETCEGKPIEGKWEEDRAVCSTDWGRCYPKDSPTSLQIKILGQEKVTDIAAYIALIYKYVVGVGAILAVVMIVWGGIVYLTAGGTPERITKAKEFISNALIGLVLLYTSYLLLQTLNPDLVKLRMPRVYMIRPITLGAEFCSQIKLGEKIKFAKAKDGEPSENFTTAPVNTKCNQEYFWEQGGTQKCWGKSCQHESKAGELKVCTAAKDTKGGKAFECIEGAVSATIAFSGGAFINNDANLYVVCSDEPDNPKSPQDKEKLSTVDVDEPKNHKTGGQDFIFPITFGDLSTEACGGTEAKIVGFYIEIEVNDAVADDWYMVGASSNEPVTCENSFGEKMKNGDRCKMSPYSPDFLNFKKEDLISMQEIVEPATFPKRYTISRDKFPDQWGSNY